MAHSHRSDSMATQRSAPKLASDVPISRIFCAHLARFNFDQFAYKFFEASLTRSVDGDGG